MPEYERPPVVETVLGVQFDRLPNFRNAHLGAYWQTLDRQSWPKVADAPPLQMQHEGFAPNARWSAGVQVKLTSDPSFRLQITNVDEDRMIQVQNSRLHLNWLGKGGADYPRFATILPEFQLAVRSFLEFVAAENLGEFRPNQWEVTYVNHIPKGTVWSEPKDWEFFRLLAPIPTIPSVVVGESFSGEWHFVIPDQLGRLHIEWQHSLKIIPGEEQEFIRLTLTARGPIRKSNKIGGIEQVIADDLDMGHTTIVKSFRDFMSPEANKYWGLKNAGS